MRVFPTERIYFITCARCVKDFMSNTPRRSLCLACATAEERATSAALIDAVRSRKPRGAKLRGYS